MNSLRNDFWISEKWNLLWSISWDMDKKIKLSSIVNQHWFLDKYSSIDFMEFLCWEQFLNKLLCFKNELEKQWVKWLALDIDETLSVTMPYWFDKLLDLYWNPENLTGIQIVEKYWIFQNVPYWRDDYDINQLLYKFREDNNAQTELSIIEWVNYHYKQIHDEIIPILSYITVRPDNISEWTSKWLEKHDFPKAEIIHIPQELEYLFWNIWKACVLDILYPNIVWIVDDNPNLIKMLPSRYSWEIFLFNEYKTLQYKHINVHVSETLDDVMINIKKIFS
jgi:hypothetical protein